MPSAINTTAAPTANAQEILLPRLHGAEKQDGFASLALTKSMKLKRPLLWRICLKNTTSGIITILKSQLALTVRLNYQPMMAHFMTQMTNQLNAIGATMSFL